MVMCQHTQDYETCRFGCTLRKKEELRLENDQLKERIKELDVELVAIRRARNIEHGAWEEVKTYQDENIQLRERIKDLKVNYQQCLELLDTVLIDSGSHIFPKITKVGSFETMYEFLSYIRKQLWEKATNE